MYFFFILFIFVEMALSVKISSLNYTSPSNVTCPVLQLGFTTKWLQSNITLTIESPTYSINHSLSCVRDRHSFVGICSVNLVYFIDGESVNFILEESGIEKLYDKMKATINLHDAFGPLWALEVKEYTQSSVDLLYHAYNEKCLQGEKILQLQLEECLHKQRWECKVKPVTERLDDSCSRANRGTFWSCLVRVRGLSPASSYKVRLRYSLRYLERFSNWTHPIYFTTKSEVPRLPPQASCDVDERNVARIRWTNPEVVVGTYLNFIVRVTGPRDLVGREIKVPVNNDVSYYYKEKLSTDVAQYSVQACTNGGCSPASPGCNVRQVQEKDSLNVPMLVTLGLIAPISVVILLLFCCCKRFKCFNLHSKEPKMKIDSGSHDYMELGELRREFADDKN